MRVTPPLQSMGSRPALAVRAASPPPGPGRIGALVAGQAASPLRPGNQLALLIDGKQAYPELERMIGAATQRIDMEFYLFHDDPTAKRIADALIAKQRAGVQVNLVVDRFGNAFKNRKMMAYLKSNGIFPRPYSGGHRFPLLHLYTITDHRKILLVDGKAGMIGGMNIGERYAEHWHDLMVKLQGPALGDLYAQFEGNWKASGGGDLRPIDKDVSAQGDAGAQISVTTPAKDETRRGLLAAIDASEQRVQVAMPYLLDRGLIKALERAAARGVKVSVILPDRTDSAVIDCAHEPVVNRLLAHGVAVRLYDTHVPGVKASDTVNARFNHLKVVTVDGAWTTIGTTNADGRALKTNQEINFQVDSPAFAGEVEARIFKVDEARSTPAVPRVYRGQRRLMQLLVGLIQGAL